jgi:uncharacterized protein YjbI with pentapeptide repeats
MPTADETPPREPRGPDLDALRREGQRLERLLDYGRHKPDRLLADAEQLLKHAVPAGAVAWLMRDRDLIDLAMARAFRVYQAAGVLPDEDLREPMPFSGESAEFVTVKARAAQKALRRGDDIVGAKLDGIRLDHLRSAADARVIDCVLVDCDLSGLDLTGAQFIHCAFIRCEFAAADLTGATMTSCKFTGRTSSRRKPGGAGFAGVIAAGTNFAASHFQHITFTSRCEGASFAYAQLNNCKATKHANFSDAQLDLATIDDFDGRNANFRGAMFVGAAFMNADLRGAHLEDAIFSSARFAGADFRGAHFSEKSRLRSAYFGGEQGLKQHVYQFDRGVLESELSAGDRRLIERHLAET